MADVKFHPTHAEPGSRGEPERRRLVVHDRRRRHMDGVHARESLGPARRAQLRAADPDIVYASVDNSNGQIWRSTDGGQRSPSVSRSIRRRPARFLGDQGWYGNAIWAGDPTDADLVIVGGVDLWRSTDGGDTLVEMSTWWSPAPRTPTTTRSCRTRATTASAIGPCFSAMTAGSTGPAMCGRSATIRTLPAGQWLAEPEQLLRRDPVLLPGR